MVEMIKIPLVALAAPEVNPIIFPAVVPILAAPEFIIIPLKAAEPPEDELLLVEKFILLIVLPCMLETVELPLSSIPVNCPRVLDNIPVPALLLYPIILELMV